MRLSGLQQGRHGRRNIYWDPNDFMNLGGFRSPELAIIQALLFTFSGREVLNLTACHQIFGVVSSFEIHAFVLKTVFILIVLLEGLEASHCRHRFRSAEVCRWLGFELWHLKCNIFLGGGLNYGEIVVKFNINALVFDHRVQQPYEFAWCSIIMFKNH